LEEAVDLSYDRLLMNEVYVFAVTFLGGAVHLNVVNSFECGRQNLPHSRRLEVEPHGTCSIGTF
jgi:hypothetical protein